MILGAERRERLSRRARGALRRLASTSRRSVVVGLPGEAGHETVAALIVPDYEDRAAIARRCASGRARARQEGRQGPAALQAGQGRSTCGTSSCRRPSTRKVKRREVIKELQRLERAAKGGAEAKQLAAGAGGATGTWLLAPRRRLAEEARHDHGGGALEELGFDSLMFTELAVALEAARRRGAPTRATPTTAIETVDDLAKLISQWGYSDKKKKAITKVDAADANDIDVPEVVATVGKALLAGAEALYERGRHRRHSNT